MAKIKDRKDKESTLLGFIVQNDNSSKNINGFDISLKYINVGYNVWTGAFYTHVNKLIEKDEIKKIKNELGLLLFFDQINQNFYNLRIEPKEMLIKNTIKDEEKAQTILNKLDLITKYLNEFEYTQPTNCFICGNEATVNILNEDKLPHHEECVKNEIQVHNQKVELEGGDVNKVPVSILFAILGAVVGLIPTFISVFFFNSMFAILYALIPLASMFGYKFGKGIQNKTMPIAIIISSIIATVLFELGSALYISSIIDMSFEEYLSTEFLPQIGMSLLFCALGILIVFKNISNTINNKKIQ